MKTILKTTTLAMITVLLLSSQSVVLGQQTQEQKLVDSIQSVAQVKRDLKETFANVNECNSGFCVTSRYKSICDLVKALDVKVNGKIIGRISTSNKQKLSISSSDLKLMKKIFSQCKPTNDQYWNYGSIIYVYSRTPKIDREIRAALGAPKSR